jgi:hypothetical protein
MYGMFFNQYVSQIGGNPDLNTDAAYAYDMKASDHIGFAIRKGKTSYGICSLRANYWSDGGLSLRAMLQMVILAIPLLLVLTVRLYRKARP